MTAADVPTGPAVDEGLTPEQRRKFLAAAERGLAPRRAILLLAAHATGGHLKHPHGESCDQCKERWPCVTVLRAAGPALRAVENLTPMPDAAHAVAVYAAGHQAGAAEAWDEGHAAGYKEHANDVMAGRGVQGLPPSVRNPHRAEAKP